MLSYNKPQEGTCHWRTFSDKWSYTGRKISLRVCHKLVAWTPTSLGRKNRIKRKNTQVFSENRSMKKYIKQSEGADWLYTEQLRSNQLDVINSNSCTSIVTRNHWKLEFIYFGFWATIYSNTCAKMETFSLFSKLLYTMKNIFSFKMQSSGSLGLENIFLNLENID